MSEFCDRCHKTVQTRTERHDSGTEIICVECGSQVDFLHDEEDDYCAAIGCCQECGANIYPDGDLDYCEGCLPTARTYKDEDDNGWTPVD